MTPRSVLAVGLGLLAACKSDPTLHDASVGDAAEPIDGDVVPDADTADTAMITTFNQACSDPPGGRAAAIPVVVISPEGAVVVAETDDNGEATVVVEPGSSVTAIYPVSSCNTHDQATFLGVVPGDHLRFGGPPVAADPMTFTGTASVTWPAQSGIDGFDLYGDCGPRFAPGDATDVQLILYDTCGTPTDDLLVVGFVAGQPSVYATFDDIVVTSGATIEVSSFQPAATQSLEMTGIPVSVATVDFALTPVIGSYNGPTLGISGAPTDGSISVTVPWAPGPDDDLVTAFFHGATYGEQLHQERIPPDPTITISDPPLLPWIDALDVDLAAGRVSWSQTGAGTYDGAVTRLEWIRDTRGGDSTAYVWSIMVPSGDAGFLIPALPAAFADRLPTASDFLYPDVWLLDTSDAAATLREIPEWSSACRGCGDLADAALPRIAVSYVAPRGAPRSANRHHLDRRQLQPLDR